MAVPLCPVLLLMPKRSAPFGNVESGSSRPPYSEHVEGGEEVKHDAFFGGCARAVVPGNGPARRGVRRYRPPPDNSSGGQKIQHQQTGGDATFDPVAGTYSSALSVSLYDATNGAAIYYTTDGTTPGKASTLYTAPITVSNTTTTIKAIATKNGFSDSAIASATYTISSTSPTTYTVGGFDQRALGRRRAAGQRRRQPHRDRRRHVHLRHGTPRMARATR